MNEKWGGDVFRNIFENLEKNLSEIVFFISKMIMTTQLLEIIVIKIIEFLFQEPIPASTAETAEPHIEDAYSGKLNNCF